MGIWLLIVIGITAICEQLRVGFIWGMASNVKDGQLEANGLRGGVNETREINDDQNDGVKADLPTLVEAVGNFLRTVKDDDRDDNEKIDGELDRLLVNFELLKFFVSWQLDKDDSAIPTIPKGTKDDQNMGKSTSGITGEVQHPFGPTSEDWANNWFSVLEYLHEGAYYAAQFLDNGFIQDRVQIARFVGAFLDNVEHSVMSMIENTDKAWSLSKKDPRRAYASLNRNENGTLASWVSDGAIIRPKEDVFDIKKMWGITSVETFRRDRVKYLELLGFIEHLNSLFNRVEKVMVSIFGVTGMHASEFMDYLHLCIARIKKTVL